MGVVIPRRRVPLARITLTSPVLMREVGLLAIRMIQARTRQGRDEHGRAFAPYARTYAERKARELGASGTPDLTVSGDLLNSLQIIEVTDTRVTIGWTR